jgi:Zn finger protein HypA/HybF involved in hydrogenase expression
MHESRLVADLINEAVRIAVANNSEDIRRVDVHIGALSHVTPLSLESLLAEAASGTVVSEATFSITKSADIASDDALDIRLVSMTIGDH